MLYPGLGAFDICSDCVCPHSMSSMIPLLHQLNDNSILVNHFVSIFEVNVIDPSHVIYNLATLNANIDQEQTARLDAAGDIDRQILTSSK